jgi:hypothetical protein
MPLYIANLINHQKIIKFLIEATPMTTIRMPTSFGTTFNGGFVAPKPNKTFTRQRPMRAKDPELSSESSDEELLFSDGHASGIAQVQRPKKGKARTSVKNSRSWIQFRELS